MNTSLIVWGPVVLVVATTVIFIWSGVITFGDDAPGLEHQAGVAPGGTFQVVAESADPADETTNTESFTEASGLELEEESIEYRDGLSKETKTKQPGLTKYTNIHFNTSKLKDLIFWNWVVDGTDARIRVEAETETQVEGGVEMKQIDPPVLTIPAR